MNIFAKYLLRRIIFCDNNSYFYANEFNFYEGDDDHKGHYSQVSPVQASVNDDYKHAALHIVPAPKLMPPPPLTLSDNFKYSQSPSAKHESYDTPNHHEPDEQVDDYHPRAPNAPRRPHRKNKNRPKKKHYRRRRPSQGYFGRSRKPPVNFHEEDDREPPSSGEHHDDSNSQDHDGEHGNEHPPVAESIIYGTEDDDGGPRYPSHTDDEKNSSHEPSDGGDDSSSPVNLKSVYGDDNFRPIINPFVQGISAGAVHDDGQRTAEESNVGFTQTGPNNAMPNFDSFGDFRPPTFGMKSE